MTETLAAGCVASVDPIVTISKREPHLPMGIAQARPELFAGRPAVHLVGMTWTCKSDYLIGEIGRDLMDATSDFPQNRFVMLANTPMESVYLSKAGIPNLLANELIFVDERLFTILPERPGLAHFDAIYVARLDPMKRQELAGGISSLVLAHSPPVAGEPERTKRLLPKARFANYEDPAGAYRYLKDEEIVSLMNRSSVGLCLSAIEGSMRASLEYRLCGTPVVSTHSLGGRDRYLVGPHARIVDDNVDAIAAAVRELKAKRFNRQIVREFVGQLVAFDRHNFLINLNKIVEHELGVRDCFRSFMPFLRYPVSWRPPSKILEPIEAPRRAASAR